jgi:hypothetical protein
VKLTCNARSQVRAHPQEKVPGGGPKGLLGYGSGLVSGLGCCHQDHSIYENISCCTPMTLHTFLYAYYTSIVSKKSVHRSLL